MQGKKRVCFSVILAFLFSSATFFQGTFCESQASQNHRNSPAISNFDFSTAFRIQGNIYPDGYFYATLNIGEPPQPYHLDIDTGSDLTWVHCDAPCVNCPKSPHKPYKPQNNALTCKDSMCTFLQHPLNYPCHDPSDQCDYEVEYADHGSSLGVLVKDNFRLQSLNGSTTRTSLVFGCGYDQDISSLTQPPFVDGVLGLANGKSSILSQLHGLKLTKNVFGHCLSGQGGGYLFFGDKLVRSETVWVPMLKNKIGDYYSVGSAELLFNGKNIVKGGLSFVLDSGSTYTYLSSQVYEALLSTIKKNIDVKQLKSVPEDKTLPVCWKGVKSFKSINDVMTLFKPLSLRFSKVKNAVLEMPPESYLIVNKKGNVCLGIMDGGDAGLENLNVLGDISMLNKMMIFDNDKSQIGWTTANCDRLPNEDRGSDIHFYLSEDWYDEL